MINRIKKASFYLVILANMGFIAWIIYLGVSQMFATSTAQFFCSAGVVGMLGINIVLLIAKR